MQQLTADFIVSLDGYGSARGWPGWWGLQSEERIDDDYPDVGLELVPARTFDGGLQLLEYVPTVLTGPPGASPRDPASRQPEEGR